MEIQEQIEGKWIVLWCAIAASALAFSIACLKGFFKPFRSSLGPTVKGHEVLLGFGLFIFAEIIAAPFLVAAIFFLTGNSQIISQPLMPIERGWMSFLTILAGFAAVLLAYLCIPLPTRRQFWNQSESAWYRQAGIGIAAWLLSFPIVVAISQAISLTLWYLFQHISNEQTVVQILQDALASPLLFGVTALSIVTIVPFAEEFLFRGLLQTWVRQKLNSPTFSILLTSVVFAFFHYSMDQGLSNIELLVPLFFLSSILGYLYERERSLWAPIALHAFFNFISVIMILYV